MAWCPWRARWASIPSPIVVWGLHRTARRWSSRQATSICCRAPRCMAGCGRGSVDERKTCSEDARFGMPEVRVGIPSVIHAALMPRLIGQSPAAWMLLTGESIDAATALSWGLVHRCVALSDLDTAVDGTARSLAGLGKQVLRQQKRLLRSW